MLAFSKPILLTLKNSVVLDSQVTQKSVDKAAQALLKLSNEAPLSEELFLVLDSPGGSVMAGLNFIQLIKSIPQRVSCIAMYAASMAHGILQQCTGDRYVTENGVIMIHRASGSISGQFNDGEMESRLAFWKQVVTNMEAKSAARQGISLEEYKKLAKDEYWCYGAQCVHDNVADIETNIKCSKKMVETTITKQKRFFFGTYKIEKSACPLIKSGKVTKVD